MAFNFEPLKFECGTENIGGFEEEVLVIPSCIVKTRPALPAAPVTEADKVTAAGAYEYNEVGQKPKFCYATQDTVGYKAENQGEVDGQSFKQAGEFFFPGNQVEVAAFARDVNNTSCDIVCQDKKGTQIVAFKVRVKPSCDLGKAPADRRGYLFSYETSHVCPVIFLGTPIDFDALRNPA